MTTTPTIRDRIKVIQAHTLAGAVTPAMVRDHLMQLTGLFGAVLDEHREAAAVYTRVLLTFIEAGDAVNRAEIRAAVTPEFARVREAKDTERLVLEMIRGCKQYLQSLDTEMKLAV